MHYISPLIPATLIRRYKRFLADVTLESGETLTVHTPNTGTMLGCADAGSQIWLRNSQNPKRKYLYSWEMSTTNENVLVGVNTHLANQLVKEAIESEKIAELTGFDAIQTEVPYGNENSRIDLLLTKQGEAQCFVEVKNVTASINEGIAIFPDAVTKRGSKHLRELMSMVEQGHEAVIFYCIARNDITEFQPADEIDTEYGQTLRKAIAQGVQAIAYKVKITPDEIVLTESVPVVCP